MHWLLSLFIMSAVSSDSLEVRFVGNAGFELYDGTTTVLVDLPYRSGYSGYMEYDFNNIMARGNVVTAITHRHPDHVEIDLLRDNDWSLFAPNEVAQSFESSRVMTTNPSTAGDFRLTKYRTPHRDTEHYSILIEWKGIKLYFVGDTEDPKHVLGMSELNLLFITSWLSCAADRTGQDIDTERKVLLHHTTDHRYSSCGSLEVYEQGESFWVKPVSR